MSRPKKKKKVMKKKTKRKGRNVQIESSVQLFRPGFIYIHLNEIKYLYIKKSPFPCSLQEIQIDPG